MRKTKKDLELENENYRKTLEHIREVLESEEIRKNCRDYAWSVLSARVEMRLEHPEFDYWTHDDADEIVKEAKEQHEYKGDYEADYTKINKEIILTKEMKEELFEMYLQSDMNSFPEFIDFCIIMGLNNHMRVNAKYAVEASKGKEGQ